MEPGSIVPHPVLVSREPGNTGNPSIWVSGDPGNSGPPDIWGPGNLGIVVLQLYGSCQEHSGREPFLECVPENMTSLFPNSGSCKGSSGLQ